VYYGGGWFVALCITLVHATDDDDVSESRLDLYGAIMMNMF